jgi:hypothetical protein
MQCDDHHKALFFKPFDNHSTAVRLGHWWTFRGLISMSALPPKADTIIHVAVSNTRPLHVGHTQNACMSLQLRQFIT